MSKWSTQACQSILFSVNIVKMRERTGKDLVKSTTSYRNIWKVIGNYKNTHRNYMD